MTGPEHYERAEQLLARAEASPHPGLPDDLESHPVLVAAANAHAVLAAAAALGVGNQVGGDDAQAWHAAAGAARQFPPHLPY